jgi:glucose-6-phosphate isomerase
MSDWTSFGARLLQPENTGLSIDLSAMDDAHEAVGLPRLEAALAAMRALEAGAIANPDEGRQVGHYWLRAPRLAPSAEQGQAVEGAIAASERVAASLMERFAPRYVLHLGIGGSALGPELLAEALAPPPGRGRVALRDYHVLDNTDPAGFEAHLAAVDPAECVVLVVSKSGGTVETRNAMLRVRQVFEAAGVDFPSRAVAITGDGSRLSRLARAESWAGELPLWDWVGGRTSVMGPVGLLPAALLGIPARELLAGAAAMDVATRAAVEVNPAAQLAAAWLLAQRERPRAMVVLPYADRLRSLSRYLQQLVMESLGKRLDRQGRLVRQGLVVYGNKGSTDQHAFVQQLRDGPDDFFCGFVELLHPGVADPVLEGGFTAGDALAGFLAGTRAALSADGKRCFTITFDALDARALGALIALFERAVGFYAELVDINAYHQPGVEAGKKAAALVLDTQQALLAALDDHPADVPALALRAGTEDLTLCWRILRRLSACGDRGVHRLAGTTPAGDRFHRG